MLRVPKLLFVIFLIILSLGLYIAFPPSWRLIEYHGIRYAFNVDSPEFVRGVVDFPTSAFFKSNIRMNRPLYIFLGWLIFKPLKFVGAERLIPDDMVRICHIKMKQAFTRANMWVENYHPSDIVLAWGVFDTRKFAVVCPLFFPVSLYFGSFIV